MVQQPASLSCSELITEVVGYRTVVKQLFPQSVMATSSSVFGALAFTCHHWARLKSLLTGTFESSNHILAGPISTGIAHGTLIGICKWPEVEIK